MGRRSKNWEKKNKENHKNSCKCLHFHWNLPENVQNANNMILECEWIKKCFSTARVCNHLYTYRVVRYESYLVCMCISIDDKHNIFSYLWAKQSKNEAKQNENYDMRDNMALSAQMFTRILFLHIRSAFAVKRNYNTRFEPFHSCS